LSRLLPRFDREREEAEAKRSVDKAEAEAAASADAGPAAAGGDPERMRGVPIIGKRNQKLRLSGAAETHAFGLEPGLAAEAPFLVLDLVMLDDKPLPTIAPQLPAEITDVWAATPGGHRHRLPLVGPPAGSASASLRRSSRKRHARVAAG